jgi:hypothetical protein
MLIFAVHISGCRHLLFRAPAGFDVHAWFESRKEALRLLGVVKAYYEILE